MRRLLSLREIPDAVFACGDLMAIGALRAIAEAVLSVPTEIAVALHALTTVRHDRNALVEPVQLVARDSA